MKNENFEQQEKNENSISFLEIIRICKSKWYWFVISLVITGGIAVYKNLTTPPTYTRYMDIMIKNEEGNDLSSQMQNFSSLTNFSSNTHINNELYVLQSPSLISEVIDSLDLNIEYFVDGPFHQQIMYGKDQLIKISSDSIDKGMNIYFDITLKEDGSFRIYNISNSMVEVDEDLELSGKLAKEENGGKTEVATPFGPITVELLPEKTIDSEVTIHVKQYSTQVAIEIFSSKLRIDIKDKEADIISIFVNDLSKERGDDILNSLLKVYNNRWIKEKNLMAEGTSQFIEKRLTYISRELEDIDANISEFKSDNLISDEKTSTNIQVNELNEIGNEILQLNNELFIISFMLDHLNSEESRRRLLPSNVGLTSSIESQISLYNQSMIRRNDLAANSSESNAMVIDLDRTLTQQRQSIVESLKNQKTTIDKQIKELEKKEQLITSKISNNPTQMQYLIATSRQQKVIESLYIFLLQKREETQLSMAYEAYNTRLITPPTGSLQPSSPNKNKTLLIALIIGLAIPLIIIYIKEALNTKVSGRKDLGSLAAPIIGEIPMHGKKNGYRFKPNTWAKSDSNLKIAVKKDQQDYTNEAFRLLRSNIEFTSKDKNDKVMLISSFHSGSGKTFITLNLGACLTLKGKKVLLVEGDMRHASLSKYIGNAHIGISNYLAGMTDNVHEIIIKSEEFPGLEYIPCGVIPPNPTELLDSPRLGELIGKLRNEYDYIIIDCPPVDIVADVHIIEKSVDRSLLIVRSGLLERSMVPMIDDIYKNGKLKNTSIILNAVKVEEVSRYNRRYGYYK